MQVFNADYGLLEHNDFLTTVTENQEFYKYMAKEYPYLSFAFKGRIKSLIRAEAKFNGYVVEYIYDYYEKNGTYHQSRNGGKTEFLSGSHCVPVVISMPKCHVKDSEGRKSEEIKYV